MRRWLIGALAAVIAAIPFVARAEYLGEFVHGQTIPVTFATYNVTTGASISISGLATTDIEVYKGTSTTQRASDNGFALIDTDGIDIDGVTGQHGFSIDTSDNSDSGFWEPGALYTVYLNSITVNSQTVVGEWKFRLDPYSITAGTAQTADGNTSDIQLASGLAHGTDALKNATITLTAGAGAPGTRLCTAYSGATNDECTADRAFDADPTTTTKYFVRAENQAYVQATSAGVVSSDVVALSTDATAADNLEAAFDTSDGYYPKVNLGQWLGTVPATLTSQRVEVLVGAASSNTLTAAALATDAVTEIQNGLATASALSTVDDFVDTEIAALTTAVADIPTVSEFEARTPTAAQLANLLTDTCLLRSVLVNDSDFNDVSADEAEFMNRVGNTTVVTVTYSGANGQDRTVTIGSCN